MAAPILVLWVAGALSVAHTNPAWAGHGSMLGPAWELATEAVHLLQVLVQVLVLAQAPAAHPLQAATLAVR